ncbi:SCO family protein [soil metagenome]
MKPLAIVLALLSVNLVCADPARAAVVTINAASAVASTTPTAPGAALPADSVLRLDGRFTDQDGKAFALSERRGRAQLVTMFYTSCPYMCPLIVDSGLGVDHALTPAERAKLRVLLVSLDPARDDVAALSALATKRKLDRQRWTLARTDAASVRKTAAVLGIRYRALANGEFNHSSVLLLLDAQGRIIARTEKMGAVPDPDFLAKVRATLAKS